MWTVIFVALMLFALGAIAWIVVRRFPQLSGMDVEQSAAERLQEFKKRIALGRILRMIKDIERKIVSPQTWQRARYLAAESYRKLKLLEDQYKARTTDAKIQLLLKRGRNHLEDDPELAERCFLDVVTFDPRNLEAYEGLSQIYLAKRAFKEATEVLEFLMKLNPAACGRYLFALASQYQEASDAHSAFKYATRALSFEPSSPKYLDFLVELAILKEHKKEGEKYLEKLKEVNPENAKIEEFENRIKNLE